MWQSDATSYLIKMQHVSIYHFKSQINIKSSHRERAYMTQYVAAHIVRYSGLRGANGGIKTGENYYDGMIKKKNFFRYLESILKSKY